MRRFMTIFVLLATSGVFVTCTKRQPQTVPNHILGQSSVPGVKDPMPTEVTPTRPLPPLPPPGDAGVDGPDVVPQPQAPETVVP